MTSPLKLLSVIIGCTIAFCSCSGQTKISSADSLKVLTKGLIITKIPNSNFTISLPPKYSLKESRGPDFSVYYFHPKDSTNRASFAGGLYLGNFPSLFKTPDTCKAEKQRSVFLVDQREFIVYNCKTVYSTQIIVELTDRTTWPQAVHIFGKAASANELKKMLLTFSTLKNIKKSK